MKTSITKLLIIIPTLLALILSSVGAVPAQAAGIYTHSVFVERAIQRLSVYGGYSELVDILNRYPATVNYGAVFPDTTLAGIDDDWAETLHDTGVTRSNYAKYLQFLADKGYDKSNNDLQTSYYRQFLEDSSYSAVLPEFRAALMSQMLDHFNNAPRSFEDEKMIAFLFGFIAHQEADLAWHWNCDDPNWMGLECAAQNLHGKSEYTLEMIVKYGDTPGHAAEFSYVDYVKPTILVASDAIGSRRPYCHTTCLLPWPWSPDPIATGTFNLNAYWLEPAVVTPAEASLKPWIQTYAPGGIDYGSALVAAAWMQAWDIMSASTYYVTSMGTGDGLSWTNASNLQYALNNSIPGQEIWVAAGVYKPTVEATDRAATFQLTSGVAVYGGFAGTEIARDQRNPAVNVTILSGDLNGDDVGFTNNGENSYHVVTGATGATLDGFTITAANANVGSGCPSTNCGGGMYNNNSNPTVTNVTFSGNRAALGGGMGNYNSNPTLTNVTFSGNSVSHDGGGMYNWTSTPVLTNVAFSDNSASLDGGGMYNVGSNPTLTNVTFSDNLAGSSGSGMTNLDSSPTIHNTVLWANTAPTGGQIVDSGTSAPVVSDSVVQDGYMDGTNIITADPRLGTLGNYGGFTQTIPLLAGSSAIDTGNDSVCPATDQRGVKRPQAIHCDIGAYEYPGSFAAVSRWTSAFDLSHGWTVSQYVRTVGDVNGDGKTDLVGFGLDGVYVALSTGSGFSAPSKWVMAFDQSHGWTVSDYVRTVGDVNADGKADVVGFGLDGVYVALSSGSGFSAPSKWITAFDLRHGWTVAGYVRTVGDVNNDGRADLVGFGQDGVYVALSTGSGFGSVSKWTSAFDLSHGWTVSQYARTVGDVNGDGKDDLVGFGQDGVYVALSTGSGFGSVSKWTSAFDLSHGWTVSQYVRTVGDVDGDGKADLVGFGLDGVYVALSTGSGFAPVSRWTTSFDLSHGWTVQHYARMVGDVSGGGKADLVGFGLDGVYIATAK